MLLGSNSTYAACEFDSTSYVCSGESSTNTEINNTNGTLSVHIDESYTTNSRNDIFITASGDGTGETGGVFLTQESGSKIEGPAALTVNNNTTGGATNLTLDGDINGTSYEGVKITNQSSSSGLIVNQTNAEAGITGKSYGIYAVNSGSGEVKITTQGKITGGGGSNSGIYALSSNSSSTGLTVTQASGSISAGNGVSTDNRGSSAQTNISLDGDVTGTAGHGVVSSESGSGYNLTQTTGVITGNSDGINVTNSGTGSTNLSLSGDVIGTNRNGITIANGANTQDVIIHQTDSDNEITGKGYGINVSNAGKGATNIELAGNVTGAGGDGVFINNGGNTTGIGIIQSNSEGSITGANYGINATNSGSGSTNIDIAGSVIGKNLDGVYVNTSNKSQDVTINQTNNEGGITGSHYGINIASNSGLGKTALDLAGDVKATSGTAIYIKADNSLNTNDLTIKQTKVDGGIQGNNAGIVIENSGTGLTQLDLAGDVTTVSGNAIDISLGNSSNKKGLIINQTKKDGEVSGTGYGIVVANGSGGSTTLNIAGSVSATGKDGIYVNSGSSSTDVTIDQSNSEGGITGSNYGVNVSNSGTGSTNITLAGNVLAKGLDGVLVNTGAKSKDVTINQTNSEGGITGSHYGINISQSGTGKTELDLAGNVIATSGHAINVVANNSLNTNNLTIKQTKVDGVIQGSNSGIIVANSGTGLTQLDLDGDVTAKSGDGINVSLGNTTNTNGLLLNQTKKDGAVSGTGYGIVVANGSGGSATLNVAGNVTGTGRNGIYVNNGGYAKDININQTETSSSITGRNYGIEARNSGTGSTSINLAGSVNGTSEEGGDETGESEGGASGTGAGGVSKSMLRLNEAIIDIKEG